MKNIYLLLFLPLLFLTGCQTLDDNEESAYGGVLKTNNELVFDFGDIDINGGVVSKTFAFENTGTQTLAIYEANTSCGCTKGAIEINQQTFGPFGMQNSIKEAIEVLPSEKFNVTINYDPLFHGPNDLGDRQRTLFLFTSAKADGETVRIFTGKPNFTEISVKGTVVEI